MWNTFADGNYEGAESFYTKMQVARTGAMQLDNEIFYGSLGNGVDIDRYLFPA